MLAMFGVCVLGRRLPEPFDVLLEPCQKGCRQEHAGRKLLTLSMIPYHQAPPSDVRQTVDLYDVP